MWTAIKKRKTQNTCEIRWVLGANNKNEIISRVFSAPSLTSAIVRTVLYSLEYKRLPWDESKIPFLCYDT